MAPPEACGGRPERGAEWAATTVKRLPQQPAQPPVRQLLGPANAETTPHGPPLWWTVSQVRGNVLSRSVEDAGGDWVRPRLRLGCGGRLQGWAEVEGVAGLSPPSNCLAPTCGVSQ